MRRAKAARDRQPISSAALPVLTKAVPKGPRSANSWVAKAVPGGRRSLTAMLVWLSRMTLPGSPDRRRSIGSCGSPIAATVLAICGPDICPPV